MLGLVCGPATIIPEGISAGHAIIDDPWLTLQAWDRREKYRDPASVFRARILAYMAGCEAEVEFLGKCAGGDGDDREQISLMMQELPIAEADEERHEARFRARTRWLVRRHRDSIEAVALALLDQDRLDDVAISDLLTATRPTSP